MAKTLADGFLVVFDGIDGVGKTTQLQLAQAALNSEGWFVQAKRNLGGTPIGEALRKVMLSPLARSPETNLYISVAIQEALIQAIAEERQRGGIILMDRGPLSLAAYEIYGSGLAGTLGWPHVDSGIKKLAPDLTIIYTANVKIALERARRQSKKVDYFENKPLNYFERVAMGYTEMQSRYQNTVALDADQPIEAVHQQTMATIKAILAKRA